MNIIICSLQGNIHRTIQVNINSSVVSRLSMVSDSSSFTSLFFWRSRSKTGGRKPGIKNRSNVQRIMNELVNCGSPNQQFLTLKEVLRNLDLRQINKLISLSTSNSSSNTLNVFPLLFDFMKQFKTSTCQLWRTIISKEGIYSKVYLDVFCKSSKGMKSKSCAKNSIIESVLNVGPHKQQFLALHDTLAHPNLMNQAVDCG